MTSFLSPNCSSHILLFLRTCETAHWFHCCLIFSNHVFLGCVVFYFFVNWEEEAEKLMRWYGTRGCRKKQQWSAGVCVCVRACAFAWTVDLSAIAAMIVHLSIYSMFMCLLLQTVPVSSEGCSFAFCSPPLTLLCFVECVQLRVEGHSVEKGILQRPH